MARLRERSRDGCLAGIQVQQLFCSNNTTIPEHQLKELNIKIDNALQVQYKPQKPGNRTIVFLISAVNLKLKVVFYRIYVSLYLQAYKAALESLGHSEYALKAGFHLNPKAVEAALLVG